MQPVFQFSNWAQHAGPHGYLELVDAGFEGGEDKRTCFFAPQGLYLTLNFTLRSPKCENPLQT